MLPDHRDPIIAIATAAGRGAVGILRLSGSDLTRLTEAICCCALQARQATYLVFKDNAGAPIDQGLAIRFPKPHSFTGEDVLELQVHGGVVVMQLLLAHCLALGAREGLRLARPGEFTERAFLNNKIDLAQAEAIADLIDASTEAGARGASRSLGGEFSAKVHGLRDALVHCRMLVEATLDFPEEELDLLQQADVAGQVQRLQAAVATVLQHTQQGSLLREGVKVVIAGQPNAGKSSLLNALAGMELAIVTAIPGTTRDKIGQTIQMEGVPVHVVDTAGLRHSDDEVEQIGIARAWEEIRGADLVLFLHDLTRRADPASIAADQLILETLAAQLARQVPVLDVWNKVDAVAAQPASQALHLSAKTGVGLPELRHQLLTLAGWRSLPEGIYMARERHVQALQRLRGHLESALALLAARPAPLELLAEELRLGQNALNEITGEFGADDLLGVIFSSFCIGK